MTTTTEATTMTTTTCTTRMIDRPGAVCGAPAVYVSGEFAECAECVKHPASMAAFDAKFPNIDRIGEPKVGDHIAIPGRPDGTIVRIGARGAIFAEFIYGNGAKRTVRVPR